MAIPFARGEAPEVFFNRREKAARLLFDESRGEVFCTWRHAVVNMSVKDVRWIMFKDTFYQKRYKYGNIQLVVSRFTCGQWKEGNACRNCLNRAWRTGCITPTHLFFVLPLPVDGINIASCEDTLDDFEAVAVERDCKQWLTRVPQLNAR